MLGKLDGISDLAKNFDEGCRALLRIWGLGLKKADATCALTIRSFGSEELAL